MVRLLGLKSPDLGAVQADPKGLRSDDYYLCGICGYTHEGAMGMNQTGTIQSKVTMLANRYPLEDAIKLFGAVEGFGAKLPQ